MNLLTLKNDKDVYYLIPDKNSKYLLKFLKNNKEHIETLEIKDIFERMNIIERETGKNLNV
jgi:hypothetical protein